MTDTLETAPETEEDPGVPSFVEADATPEERAEAKELWAGFVSEQNEKLGIEDKPAAKDGELDWSRATPEQRDAFEAAQSARQQAEQDKKAADGRAATAQRNMDAFMASGGSTPPARPTAPPPPSEPSAEFRAVLEEYPDIAKPFAEEMARVTAGHRAELEDIRHNQQRMQAALQTVGEDRLTAHSESQVEIVRQAHPDLDDISDSDDFVAWAESQPEMIRQGVKANAETIMDAESVNVILDQYKRDKGIAPNGNGSTPKADPRRAAQLRSNSGTPSSSPGAPARDAQGRFRSDTETEADVWAELVRAEEKKQRAEARA